MGLGALMVKDPRLELDLPGCSEQTKVCLSLWHLRNKKSYQLFDSPFNSLAGSRPVQQLRNYSLAVEQRVITRRKAGYYNESSKIREMRQLFQNVSWSWIGTAANMNFTHFSPISLSLRNRGAQNLRMRMQIHFRVARLLAVCILHSCLLQTNSDISTKSGMDWSKLC